MYTKKNQQKPCRINTKFIQKINIQQEIIITKLIHDFFNITVGDNKYVK